MTFQRQAENKATTKEKFYILISKLTIHLFSRQKNLNDLKKFGLMLFWINSFDLKKKINLFKRKSQVFQWLEVMKLGSTGSHDITFWEMSLHVKQHSCTAALDLWVLCWWGVGAESTWPLGTRGKSWLEATPAVPIYVFLLQPPHVWFWNPKLV